MALTVIKPSGIETSGNYTVNGMNVSANASVANLSVTTSANLGDVGNVIITGGTNGYVLQTNGSGNLSWVAQSGGGSTSNISNGNSNVNIPTANGNINFSAVGNTVMVITGTGVNTVGTLNVSGNATVGNLITNGGNITNANVISANTFIASSNITAGNANLGNLVTANFFTGNGSILSALTFGNITTFNTAGLTTDELYLQAITRLNVTASGSSGYLFDQYGATINPALYITSGQTLAFNLNVSGHPFLIQTSGGANYNVGLEHVDTTGTVLTTSSAQGQISGTLYWKVPYGITGNYKYQCSIHGDMNGNIVVTDANVANITVGLATYATTANSVAGANVSGAVAYATTANSVAGANVSGQVANSLIAGTVYTNAQPNITSVGTLTDLSVSGNGVFGGNLTVNGTLTYINSTTLSISDPIINLQTGPNGAAPVANTGKDVGTALNYYDTSAKIAWMGWDISNAEIAFGSNVGISSEVVTFTELANIRSGNAQLGNNVTANYFTGNGSLLTGITTTSISNGNSNVNIPTANGNINLTAVGNTVMVITGTGANISGTANVTGNLVAGNITAGSGTGGNITGGNVISANTFTASGNITAGNANLGNAVSANFFIGSGNNLSNISGSNVTGQVGNALVSGTVYTNAQPNITSVGSLTGLTVSNATGIVDFTTTANVTLGAVANVHISGGTNAYVLSTDGAGNLSWVAQSGGGGGANISNGNSNVNIPVADGNINFSATGNANVMTITGTGANISGYANITGNIALSGADVSLGNVSNLHITGGSNTFVLSTDGSGNLSWAAASGTSIGVDNFTGNGVQTAYTLTTTPANANATLVSIAGTFQPRTVYSLTGNVITFSSAPPNTAPIEVTTFTAGSGGGGGGITAQDLLSPFLLMGA